LGLSDARIIRNGVNDKAQDIRTAFTVTGGQGMGWSKKRNGNGAVCFGMPSYSIPVSGSSARPSKG
jgi:hypothetical protein